MLSWDQLTLRLLCVIIIICIFIHLYHQKEKFVDQLVEISTEEQNSITNDFSTFFGQQFKKNEVQIFKIKNTNQLVFKNLYQLTKLTNFYFKNNFQIMKDDIKYQAKSQEPVNNIYSGLLVSHPYNCDSNHLEYGFIVNLISEELSIHSALELSLDFSENHTDKLNNLLEIQKIKDSMNYQNLPRKTINLLTETKSETDYKPYFSMGDSGKKIKILGRFLDATNLDFIKSFPDGRFNILDSQKNPILSYCKIDTPYCNIHLPPKPGKKHLGRNQYVVGKFSYPQDQYVLLDSSENIKRKEEQAQLQKAELEGFQNLHLLYDTEKECKKKDNRDKHLKQIKEEQVTAIPNNHPSILDFEEAIPKLQEMNGLMCRQHHNTDIDDYYYGGLNEKGISMCVGKNQECTLFTDQKECETKISSAPTPGPLIEKESLDKTYPGYVGDELIDKLDKLNFIQCQAYYQDEITCKHLKTMIDENGKKLPAQIVDIITFSESLEKHPEKIIDNISFLENINKDTLVDYLIEPCAEIHKNINPISYFEMFKYKIKVEKITGGESLGIGIYKEEKLLDYIRDNDQEIIDLKKEQKLYLYVDKNEFLNLEILSKNDTVLGKKRIGPKLKGKFGDNINLNLRTNNINIFKNLSFVRKLSQYQLAYNPFVTF